MEHYSITRFIPPARPERSLQKVAQELEAGFLTEMLKAGGFGAPRDAFGGGSGEDVFSSLLLREQAKLMVENGGIGLVENIVRSLMQENGNV